MYGFLIWKSRVQSVQYMWDKAFGWTKNPANKMKDISLGTVFSIYQAVCNFFASTVQRQPDTFKGSACQHDSPASEYPHAVDLLRRTTMWMTSWSRTYGWNLARRLAGRRLQGGPVADSIGYLQCLWYQGSRGSILLQTVEYSRMTNS